MNIMINGDSCFMCGSREKLTTHHCIPSHLSPRNNILITLCKSCHDKINNEDMVGMFNYLYLISNKMKNLDNELVRVGNIIEERYRNEKG